jgi:hypothetical protein
VGVVAVGVAVVGGRTSGSAFSPHPARGIAAAAIAATIKRVRRPPAFDPRFTPRNLTQAAGGFAPWSRGISESMDDELKLGFLRLGRWLEDPVNMGVGLVFAWAIIALLLAIALAMSPGDVLLLILGGVAVALLLRRPIELAARRWRQARLELERDREPSRDAPSPAGGRS